MLVEFFILLFIHIIGDFYLQWDKMARCKIGNYDKDYCGECEKCKSKPRIKFKVLLLHVAIYSFLYLLLLIWVKWYFVLLIVGMMVSSHFLIDMFTCFLKIKWKHSFAIFLIDQILHIIMIYVVVLLAYYKFNMDISNLSTEFIKWMKRIVYVLVLIKPTSVLIDCLFMDMFGIKNEEHAELEMPKSKTKAVLDSGIIIGITERLIVLVLMVLEAYPTIAIIITVKTWARSGGLKDNKNDFREKYLVGTLLSLAIAMGFGLLYARS